MARTPTLFDGIRRRDAGMESVRTNDPAEFQAAAREAIERLAATGRPFTSDSLRGLVDVEPHHVNAWGAAVAAAVNEGRIVNVGYRKSSRPAANGRVVAQYVGVDR